MKLIGRTDIATAKTTLENGGILAVPTETVMGLAVSIKSEAAIDKLLDLKKRAIGSGKVLTIMVASVDEISKYAFLSEEQKAFARHYFPGELTLILEKNPSFSHPYFDHFSTIGIRIPAHSYMLKLLRKTGPLLVTSANPRGEKPCMSDEEVKQRLPEIKTCVKGSAGGSLPSTIIDWSGSMPRQVRAGGLLIVHY